MRPASSPCPSRAPRPHPPRQARRTSGPALPSRRAPSLSRKRHPPPSPTRLSSRSRRRLPPGSRRLQCQLHLNPRPRPPLQTARAPLRRLNSRLRFRWTKDRQSRNPCRSRFPLPPPHRLRQRSCRLPKPRHWAPRSCPNGGPLPLAGLARWSCWARLGSLCGGANPRCCALPPRLPQPQPQDARQPATASRSPGSKSRSKSPQRPAA